MFPSNSRSLYRLFFSLCKMAMLVDSNLASRLQLDRGSEAQSLCNEAPAKLLLSSFEELKRGMPLLKAVSTPC
jgi:hypothetical protein